jgi:hypothetical protein
MKMNEQNEVISIEIFGHEIEIADKTRGPVKTFKYSQKELTDLIVKILDCDNSLVTSLQLLEELNPRELAFLATNGLLLVGADSRKFAKDAK